MYYWIISTHVWFVPISFDRRARRTQVTSRNSRVVVWPRPSSLLGCYPLPTLIYVELLSYVECPYRWTWLLDWTYPPLMIDSESHSPIPKELGLKGSVWRSIRPSFGFWRERACTCVPLCRLLVGPQSRTTFPLGRENWTQKMKISTRSLSLTNI
jgi:hypothetical protein